MSIVNEWLASGVGRNDALLLHGELWTNVTTRICLQAGWFCKW